MSLVLQHDPVVCLWSIVLSSTMTMAPGLSHGVRGPPDMSLVLFWALLFSLLLDLCFCWQLLLLLVTFLSVKSHLEAHLFMNLVTFRTNSSGYTG